MPKQFEQIGQLSEGATDVLSVDMSPWLEAGENLDSITVEEIGTTDLTIPEGSVGVSTAELTILGQEVAAGLAFQALISGAVKGTTYRLRCTMITDANTPRTEVYDFILIGV